MKAQLAGALLALLLTSSSAFGQPAIQDDSAIHTHALESKHINVEFKLRVRLPRGYGEGNQKYEVLYYLDAWKSNGFIDELTRVLGDEIPNLILVGIDITLNGVEPGIARPKKYWQTRSLAFTPTKVDNYEDIPVEWTGGAPRFLQCLETELIPLIDQTYRTIPEKRTLLGHSFGGLFCLFTLLERPNLFENIVASSPPLHFGDHAMLRIESEFAERHPKLPTNLYYAVGSREDTAPQSQMVQSLIAFREQLESRKYEKLNTLGVIHDGETHASNRLVTYLHGLRYVFSQADSKQ